MDEGSGFVNAGRGGGTASGTLGGARSGCGAGTGARGAAENGASVAVSTNRVFDGGAGASWRDMPNRTSTCSTMEASTHHSSARSWT